MSGELKYWINGFPFQGIQNASADEKTVKYWKDGFPSQELESSGSPPAWDPKKASMIMMGF